MDYQFIVSNTLMQLLFFIGWSSFLYGASLIITKVVPTLVNWSRFWQAWLCFALIPLIPSSLYQVGSLIPDVLTNAFADRQQNLLAVSHSVIHQTENITALPIFTWLVLPMIVVGCCLSLLRFSLSVFKVNKFVQQASLNNELIGFQSQQKSLVERYNIRVLITEQEVSPMVFGFFRNNLLLPKSVFNMSEKQRFLLIEHELMHIKRHDPKAVIISRLCACLFWFNPFIRYFEKRFLQTMELNCDLAVISIFPKEKLNYASALIESLKLTKNTVDSGITSSFSGPQFSKRDFEKRIKMAMSEQSEHKYGLSQWLALVLLSLPISFISLAAKPFISMPIINATDLPGIKPVVNGRISSGYKDISAFRGNKLHRAIDFAASIGTKVVASFSGKVLIADDATLHRNYGKVVLIEHEGKLQSLYAHLDSFSVEAGQYISAGQKLGTVGETGRTTGPHLHFELLKDGQHTDPKQYLNLHKN